MAQSFATTTNYLYDTQGNQIAGVNDLFIGQDGNIVLAGRDQTNEGQLQAVLYACANAAKTQLGEIVLNTARGLPNFQLIWNGVPNLPLWESALRQILLSVNGVAEIETITVQRATDTETYSKTNDILIYTATIITDFGTGAFDGTI